MPDQADQLRQLVQQANSADEYPLLPPIVAISGGKLGVGASTVAVQLTRALAVCGCQAAMIDADFHRADATSCSGVELPAAYTVADILVGRRTISEVLRRSHAGFFVLPSDGQPGSVPEFNARCQQRLVASLRWLQQRVDIVVVDTGTGSTPWSQWWWQASCEVLVVTTVDDVAVMDTYAMLKIAAHGGTLSHVRLLVNRCNSQSLADGVHQRIGQACFRFLGELVPAERYLPEENAPQRKAQLASPSCQDGCAEYTFAMRQLAASIASDVARVNTGHCAAA